MSSKKYGLILPEKGRQGPTFQASRNVFGNDSDSDEDTKKKPVLLRPSDNINRQAKITQEKAVIEDPTVYQYDEIYDDMVGSKEKEKKKSKEDVKPKYIENLIKSANKRKIENERRIERQIQKERENEGEEFKDKEVFVTTAYKKKLEEMKQEEEKEKREEYLESIGDVTKQRDLGGFYRHLYEQKLGSDKPQAEEKDKKPEKEDNASEARSDAAPPEPKTETSHKRNYRKRKSSEKKAHISDGEIEDSDNEINRVNLDDIKSAKRNKPSGDNIDADSDFSIDESSDEDTEKKPKEKENIQKQVKTEDKSDTPKKDDTKDNIIKQEDKPKDVPEVKPKVDIWKKRTVGILFDEALKRYYERKAARAC